MIATEPILIARMMSNALHDRKHQFAAPNLTMFYQWEADLLSVTNANFVHEWEIKTSLSDYRADKKKAEKHEALSYAFENKVGKFPYTAWNLGGRQYFRAVPNYFWYVTSGFEIDDLPPYAGWITAEWNEHYTYWKLTNKVTAPRIHNEKMGDSRFIDVARWLSFKLRNAYNNLYAEG